MEKMIPNGAPSLAGTSTRKHLKPQVGCKKLVVEGDVTFASGVVIKGTVTIKNSGASKEVPAGTYEDTVKEIKKEFSGMKSRCWGANNS